MQLFDLVGRFLQKSTSLVNGKQFSNFQHTLTDSSLPLIASHTLISHLSFSQLYCLFSLVFASISNALTGSNHLTLLSLHFAQLNKPNSYSSPRQILCFPDLSRNSCLCLFYPKCIFLNAGDWVARCLACFKVSSTKQG